MSDDSEVDYKLPETAKQTFAFAQERVQAAAVMLQLRETQLQNLFLDFRLLCEEQGKYEVEEINLDTGVVKRKLR